MAHGAWVAWARAVRSGRGRRWVPGHAYRACERGVSTGWGGLAANGGTDPRRNDQTTNGGNEHGAGVKALLINGVPTWHSAMKKCKWCKGDHLNKDCKDQAAKDAKAKKKAAKAAKAAKKARCWLC